MHDFSKGYVLKYESCKKDFQHIMGILKYFLTLTLFLIVLRYLEKNRGWFLGLAVEPKDRNDIRCTAILGMDKICLKIVEDASASARN